MQNHQTISKNIYRAVQEAQRILVIAHQKPDGDTLGSNLAFYNYLKKIGKAVDSFCVHPAPPHLSFLPASHLISNDPQIFKNKYDLIIVLDSSNLEYAGVAAFLADTPLAYKFINIDHHQSNLNFGHINLVLTDASSTNEVLYRLFKDWRIDWDADIATCLACGMITDTGGFRNPATNYQTLLAAADLKSKGANLHKIINHALNNLNINNLRLWGRALERLKKVDKYNLIYTFLTEQDFAECGTDESAVDGISNFLHILKEGEIIMVLRQSTPDIIKGSLRTTSDIDLTKLAGLFDGGGHKKASGFSLPGRLVYDNNKLVIK